MGEMNKEIFKGGKYNFNKDKFMSLEQILQQFLK